MNDIESFKRELAPGFYEFCKAQDEWTYQAITRRRDNYYRHLGYEQRPLPELDESFLKEDFNLHAKPEKQTSQVIR